MIQASGIYKSFGDTKVLQDVAFQVEKGEVVSLTGASGAGKSTLLHITGTLLKPDQGSIIIEGEDITKLKGNALSDFRNSKIGFIFQFHQLLPEFTALENAALPAMIAGVGKKKALEQAADLLDYLKLSLRSSHKPGQLSGGEQQRVAVARALVNKPAVIMADEPSGNLDAQNAESLHQLFFQLRNDFGHTFLIVTHNEMLASQSDRVFRMSEGRIT